MTTSIRSEAQKNNDMEKRQNYLVKEEIEYKKIKIKVYVFWSMTDRQTDKTM